MLTEDSMRKGFLGFICVVVFISSLIIGVMIGDPEYRNFSLDMTRTALCCGNPTTHALINETQTSAIIKTENARIQVTQTHIADTQATIEAHRQPTLDE